MTINIDTINIDEDLNATFKTEDFIENLIFVVGKTTVKYIDKGEDKEIAVTAFLYGNTVYAAIDDSQLDNIPIIKN